MSQNTTNTTVNLLINGQQAEQKLQELRASAMRLETAISRAAVAGNKVELKKLRKELTSTKKEIREIESSTMQVESVMKRLNRATPQELNRTLANLNRQLNYLERGSAAWNKHTEKIRMVKAELAKMNMEMRSAESWVSRMNKTINNWSMSIMGAIAAMSGIIYASRNAVKAFADMDEELANTHKYTGMAVEDVAKLNDEFKKMNTRTSRQELNELAQEAGRLGKNTLEDVKGYVEAADIIRVALVDLGDGATQTIAKLTNIFGVEQLKGTKDAMLAVGSTVNVLSQNCTASKPYLVDFAQRMAGVGAQSKMTIPEILAFGAALDANGQKVEMSSSAISKLIMKLFQDTSGIAKQVGLDVNSFTEALHRSTNEGLLMFLEQIKALGSQQGLAVLAPMFKDLGMDGVRMSQVLATLAEHLDMVKWEQEEANKAFKEASSATNEYNIFNNTTQATLDKARNRVHELAIELGQSLLPVMKHVYTSTTFTLTVLNTSINFMKQHGATVLQLTAIIAAYTIGVNLSAIATKANAAATALWNTVAGAATSITKGYTVAMSLSKDAIVGCSLANQRLYRHMLAQNVITKLLTASTILMKAAYYACTLQFTAMIAALKSLYVVMAANPYGLVLAAITALGVAIYRNIQAKKERMRIMEEERKQEREAMKEYTDEYAHIKMLTAIVNDNTKALDDRRSAIEQLKKIVPEYNAQLSDEGVIVNNNTVALDNYLAKLKEVVRMKANRDKLEELYKREQELEEQEQSQSDQYWKIKQQNSLQGFDENSVTGRLTKWWGNITGNENMIGGIEGKLNGTRTELRSVRSQIAALEPKIKPEPVEPTETPTTTPTVNYNPSSGDDDKDDKSDKSKKEDKFAAEKDWRAREEALTRIAYATGKIDYEAYTTGMLEIEEEFYAKCLEHQDLSETERLTLQAQYYEAGKKLHENDVKWTIEEEKTRYDEEQALLKQNYIDGKITTEQYNNAIELSELEHLRRMVQCTEKGTEERLKAEAEYRDKLLADMKKRQKEAERLEKEHLEKVKKLKEKYLGNTSLENKDAFEADMSALTEAYQKMISDLNGISTLTDAGENDIKLAKKIAKEKLKIEKDFHKAKLDLMKKYEQEGRYETMNTMEQMTVGFNDWLEGDGGQAIMKSAEMLVSSMSSIISSVSEIVQAELQIQTAAIEKKYEKEISLAEGNSYREKAIEEKKQKELAKAKSEANKKMFAMQVINAVAQTALSAINAYSSAAAIPVVGWIMAPIAAATAVAAGMVQIAALKKQQQASEAQGYAEGGYTKKGGKYEEAGIVHAGEWVASQELLANPVASQMIATLDHAQKTNTIGSLRTEDVSNYITAPMQIAESSRRTATSSQIAASNSKVAVIGAEGANSGTSPSELTSTLSELSKRLNEPFVTINTIEGDHGIKKAQDDYDRLMKNKSPKSQR